MLCMSGMYMNAVCSYKQVTPDYRHHTRYSSSFPLPRPFLPPLPVLLWYKNLASSITQRENSLKLTSPSWFLSSFCMTSLISSAVIFSWGKTVSRLNRVSEIFGCCVSVWCLSLLFQGFWFHSPACFSARPHTVWVSSARRRRTPGTHPQCFGWPLPSESWL